MGSRLPQDSILHLMLEVIMTALDFSSYGQMVVEECIQPLGGTFHHAEQYIPTKRGSHRFQ